MSRLWLTLLWLAGLLAIATTWWSHLRPGPERGRLEQSTARAVSRYLDAYVDERAGVVRELAERFGGWETMPEPAVAGVLRTAATRHLALRRLVVADPSGRVVSGYDADRPVGREQLPAGLLDPVLDRRAVLKGQAALLVVPSAEAGTLQHLELAAAIRRGDGSRPGYVGATLSLGRIRQALRRLLPPGVRLSVTTPAGQLLLPCRGVPVQTGARVAGRRFDVRVQARSRPDWPTALIVTLLILPVLLIVTLGIGRLDRDSQMGKP